MFRLYLIQTHVKNKTGVGIASTTNVTENIPATELENGETCKDLSNREFKITENDLNYSTVTSLKVTRCSDKFPPVHNERFAKASRNYKEIDLTLCDVSVQKETRMQKGSETWDPSHIYSAVNKKSTKTALKKTTVKSNEEITALYAVVNKKKPKVQPRSSEYGGLDSLELNDPGNDMYSNVVNSMKKKPQLKLNDPVSDTCDPNYSVIDKKTKPKCQVTDYIPDSTEKITIEQEEEAPEIPLFDLSMMYPAD